MEADLDKEIDLMLRHHAVRSKSASTSNDEHIDADALNAYVEHVLPDATHARYTSHLSNCDDCRKTLVSLLPLTDLARVADEPVETLALKKASWITLLSEQLGSLFTPRALQFVAPVLAIAIVGIVGLNVYQNKNTLSESARTSHSTVEFKEKTGEPQSRDERSTKSDPAPAFVDEPMRREREQQSRSVVPSKEQTTSNTETGDSSSVEKDITRSQPDVAGKDEQKKGGTAGLASPGSGPTKQEPFATTDEVVSVKAEDVDKRKADKPANAPPAAAVADQSLPKTTSVESKPSENRADNEYGIAARRRGPSARLKTREGETVTEPSASVETRNVEGRKFRRSGDKWIDTAYSPSQPTINVKRSSEQYRALVGDEPALRSISESLSGEVIVLWKGRAYRIH
jgi:hypothetical protein